MIASTAIFKRYIAWLVIAIVIGLCQACAYSGLSHRTDSGPEESTRIFQFQDGGQAIYFSLDKSLPEWPPVPAVAAPDTFLFVISGSDCRSMKEYLPQYFRGLEGESGPVRLFVLHKRFIEERTWEHWWGCGKEFIDADYPSRWITDQTEFITAQLRAARHEHRLPKRIVLLGISEGGDIVPLLAQHVPGVSHVAILSNGGMDPAAAYRLQAKKQGFTAVIDVLDSPTFNTSPYAGGRALRYWSELQELKQTDALLALSIPVLIAMGENDQSVPIESAWHIRDRFMESGKTNLTLLSYPGADHGLNRNGYSHLPDFWHVFDMWLGR
jgi:dienelactone hydrolase